MATLIPLALGLLAIRVWVRLASMEDTIVDLTARIDALEGSRASTPIAAAQTTPAAAAEKGPTAGAAPARARARAAAPPAAARPTAAPRRSASAARLGTDDTTFTRDGCAETAGE